MWLYKCTIYHKIEDSGLIANIYLFGSHFAPGVTFLEMIKKKINHCLKDWALKVELKVVI